MKPTLAATIVCLLTVTTVRAREHRAETAEVTPPSENLAKEVAELLSHDCVKVIRGTKRTVCEIWLCKEWPVKASFKPNDEVLYPFEMGQLIGVVRYRRKGNDFRDQEISKGIYTLRYGQQPVDGNHEGTSPSRDFLCLVQAEQDKSADPIGKDEMLKLSAEAAQSNHPAILCLPKTPTQAKRNPVIGHDEERDWWILYLAGVQTSDGKSQTLPLNVVIVGKGE